MAAPVLTLQTITERQHLLINQKPYDLRRRHEVSMQEQIFLERNLPRLADLVEAAADHVLTTADEAELHRLLEQVTAMALVAPTKIRAALTDVQRVQICHVFLELPLTPGPTTAARPRAQSRTSRSTGTRSSRGSSGSTAATR